MADRRFDRPAWTEGLFRRTDPRHGYDGAEGAEFEAWQRAFRADLRETLGLPAVARNGVPDLDPRRLDVEQCDGYERQRWVVRTEPDVEVPFYVLLPGDAEPPHPVVFAVHGHTPAGKELTVGRQVAGIADGHVDELERDFARQAVQRGYAAVAPDVRGFGELADADGWRDNRWTCGRLQMHGQLFGRSLVGDRVWDVERLVEFVEGHDTFDAERLAITGHSGGGTVTLFAGALDERFSPVVPCGYVCSWAASIAADDHCECNYVPGVAELGSVADVAGLIAPRPLRVLAGRDDTTFPLEGVRSAYADIEQRYEGAGVPGRCDLYVGEGGHRYFADGAWPFVEEHL